MRLWWNRITAPKLRLARNLARPDSAAPPPVDMLRVLMGGPSGDYR